ncbi:MAG: hypothetical protein H7323_08870 [Frankiales bacterium]|nr:hypothetical protein [Frankiales bacterium]
MTGPLAQLCALLQLRWQMARAPGLRLAMVLGAMLVGYLLHLIVVSAATIDAPLLATAIQVAPSAYLGFSGLALIAPLTAGGGNEVVPPDQLVAFPVRPSTQFLGGLVLAPLNLVWVLQLLVLVALTAYLTIGGSFVRGALATGAFVVAITVIGQGLAWTVVGLRQTRRGRRIVCGVGLALLVGVVVVVRGGHGERVLDVSPTHSVVSAVISGGAGGRRDWLMVTAALMAVAVAAALLGSWACRWALGRPGDAGSGRRSEPVRRRGPKASALRELVAVDRASVWRAPALRRGGLVLVVLPGLVAAGAAVPWQSLIVLPGLVAAGAGLLFGINAFCLDGSGAVWLASLPHEPHLVARAKTIVLTETVLGAVVVAALAGSLRSPGSPTAAEVVGIVATGLSCTATVVASCLHSSVHHPHRAELRGPRDAVAPPGALALASVRLATPTAFAGVLIASAADTGVWWLPLGLALPVILAAGLSLNRSLRRYDDPVVRARVVQVVSAG